MKIQFKRNSSSSSTMPSSVNAGEPVWFKDKLYIGSVGTTVGGTGSVGSLVEIARADHNHSGVYQPAGTYLTTFNAADNYAFKSITPNNDGATNNVTTAPSYNSTTITAGSNTATLTISAYNKWLSVLGDNSAKKFSIAHRHSGVTAGTYKSVTVDAAGHVTAGTNPTTLAGYGITDGDKVKQVASTADVYGRLMITSKNTPSASGSIANNFVDYAYYSDSIMANPSTGDVVSATYRATGNNIYVGASTGSQCHQQYDSTTKSLKFIFD